ncbi:TPA: tail protein X [Stenotrophomonas maltophilia]|jgi:phage tail protein X|uniref:Tail protein X n=1 Tax=Stenotrophomonas maltophilia TaxID=40324 RepID=A0AAI9G2N5_STEMA|nr:MULTISPECIES: tail protein X [Stenotrophomonas]MPS44884.1 phage tail protein [Stenotrophomonas sp.]EKT4441134.1 tail protein X [Stenotrophomonas maltophilia]EKT4444243.1 tail protein X [Stenotrophomonas maltophilia]ELC7364185.1 tail protein X [Stenotrophomonas maltophilia]ELF4107565.1 tail protein X [Stenotrophomonas maltophilia]
MARTYNTRDGDVVDRIAYAHYGEQSPAILRAVFDANPGLAARGPVLAAGLAITLPEVQRPAGERKGIALWD